MIIMLLPMEESNVPIDLFNEKSSFSSVWITWNRSVAFISDFFIDSSKFFQFWFKKSFLFCFKHSQRHMHKNLDVCRVVQLSILYFFQSLFFSAISNNKLNVKLVKLYINRKQTSESNPARSMTSGHFLLNAGFYLLFCFCPLPNDQFFKNILKYLEVPNWA